MVTRRRFLHVAGLAGLGLALPTGRNPLRMPRALAQLPGGTLDPTSIPKYVTPLVKPPAMPTVGGVNRYEIAVRQFGQHILPASMGLPMTTVWSYGSTGAPGTVAEGGSFFYPAFTIEATHQTPVRVKWINDLVDGSGNYLPHLLPVDQTLHWCNPPGGLAGRDMRTNNPEPYTGPVPMVTHLHGGHTTEESDGYPEAWWLPNANNIPAGYATTGTFYDRFMTKYGLNWEPGTATFTYSNDQRATTLWYHDHALGITRVNVYAGPAGFYLIRGGLADQVTGTLPGPAPSVGDDPFGTYYEIPIVIQDRSFNADGSLYYPDNRAFFEGLDEEQLQIPFIPETACNGEMSDISAIWNPEFFANTMVVNGQTWPYLEVEQRRYRFRFLNGCNSRFLILKMDNDQSLYVIGGDGGFLPATVQLDTLLLGPAERADVILDFTDIPVGSEIVLQNIGPDEPFGGGVPGVDFAVADPNTTGQVMQFRVIAAQSADPSTPPMDLVLPAAPVLGDPMVTRQISLNEEESSTVFVDEENGDVVLDCMDGERFAPKAALLGTVTPEGAGNGLLWSDAITERPMVGSTEVWEIHNFTEDAHPIHVHLVRFLVLNREDEDGTIHEPEVWESGYKDTVIAYPEQITRIKAKFGHPGLFVWHCHILEHEDNEMMRPFEVLPYRTFMPYTRQG